MSKNSRQKAGAVIPPRPFSLFRRKPGFPLSPFRPYHLWKGKHFAPLGGILIALIVFILTLTQPAQFFEWRTYDMRFKHKETRTVKSDLAIVFIGDDSIRSLGHWPWSWNYHALLVDILKRHGAKAVVFDILFAETPPGVGQDTFKLAMKSAGNVYLSSYFNRLERESLPGLPRIGLNLTEPVPVLKEQARGTGHCNAVPDPDGITRRVPLLVRYSDGYYPSAALLVALDQLGVDFKDLSFDRGKWISIPLKDRKPIKIPIDDDGQTMVNFAGDKSSFEVSYSFLEVLQADKYPDKAVVDLERLRDKFVLVGVTFAGNTDLRPTPLSEAYPMLCILGNSIDNILQDDFFRRASMTSRLLMAILLGAITGFLAYVLRPIYSLPATALFMGASIGFSIHQFDNNNLWIDVIAPLSIILANYMAMTTIQYIQNRREKLRYLEYLKYMNDLVGSSNDAIVSFDLDGRIATWNTGAEKIFGWPERDALMKNWGFLVSSDDKKMVGEALHAVYNDSRHQSLELKGSRRGGQDFPASMNLSPVEDSQGLLVGISCISQDLSEKKKMVEMLMQSEKMAELGRLGSGIVHEIKNPLTSIMMLTGMLLSTKSLKPKPKKYISIIDQEAQRILRLCQNILSFARPKRAEMKSIELNKVVKETIELVEYELKKNHVILDLAPKKESITALGDDEKLKQVFLNLIMNAVHAMGGGGRLEIAYGIMDKSRILIPEGYSSRSAGSIRDGRCSVVTFQDEGCGIPPENLEKIFEPFYSTKAEGQGTGLGLYISKNIILEHRGSLTVASKPGKGTIFYITIPGIEEEAKNARKKASAS